MGILMGLGMMRTTIRVNSFDGEGAAAVLFGEFIRCIHYNKKSMAIFIRPRDRVKGYLMRPLAVSQ
jgi:hypothetical protein